MHAVTIVDGDLRWQERPDPVPRTNEVAVTVAAAGINAADLLQRAGHYPPPPGWPVDVPGMEFAGRVLRAGPGAGRFAPGDRVMALCGGGGQAEVVVVPESCLLPVPDAVDDAAAGGFPEAFSTAEDALFSQAGLAAGERVVISGAAGGVGTAAVQLARAAGAEVVATVRDPSLHARVAGLGAHTVVLPGEVADHGPYDVSLELVGAPGITAVLPALATGARRCHRGRGRHPARARPARGDGVAWDHPRSTLRSRSDAEKAAVAGVVEANALALLAAGEVGVPVAETFPMAEATAAYERFAAGGKFGKIVLLTGSS